MDNIIQKNRFLYDFNYITDPRRLNDLLLYQLGEIYCDNGASLKEHIHDDFFEFSLITEGSGFFYAADIKTPVEKNDFFISLPYESHERNYPEQRDAFTGNYKNKSKSNNYVGYDGKFVLKGSWF